MPTTPMPTAVSACLGGDSCCSPTSPCGEGQGDCDTNNDCLGELVCVNDGCDRTTFPSFDSTDDCCLMLSTTPDPSTVTGTNPTTIYPETDSTTISPTSTTTVVPLPCLGGDSCCSPSSPCGEGQGDCDRDADCLGGLICVEDGCDRTTFPSFDPTDDCCLWTSATTTDTPTTPTVIPTTPTAPPTTPTDTPTTPTATPTTPPATPTTPTGTPTTPTGTPTTPTATPTTPTATPTTPTGPPSTATPSTPRQCD